MVWRCYERPPSRGCLHWHLSPHLWPSREHWGNRLSAPERACPCARLPSLQVPAGPILSTADIVAEPQYQQRGMIQHAAPPSGARPTGLGMAWNVTRGRAALQRQRGGQGRAAAPVPQRGRGWHCTWGGQQCAVACADVRHMRGSLLQHCFRTSQPLSPLLPSSPPAGGQQVTMPAMLPVLHGTPGATRWAGPDLGEHTEEVLRGELGLGDADIQRLRDCGAI